jgi:hypothetical protein
MKYLNQFAKKANQIRKKNWSAPTIMAVFIFVCMIIVYSFEIIGLAKKEKNLIYRNTTPEQIIKVVATEVEEKEHRACHVMNVKLHGCEGKNNSLNVIDQKESDGPVVENSDKILYEKIRTVTQIDREEHNQQMFKILIEGVKNQLKYEGEFGEEYVSDDSDDSLNYEAEFFDV